MTKPGSPVTPGIGVRPPGEGPRVVGEVGFSANDIAGALDTLADDATWWIAGKPGHLPAAGVHGKEEMARMFHDMVGRLKGGLKMTVKSSIAEGDRVALEISRWGRRRPRSVPNSSRNEFSQLFHRSIAERRP
jgi:ketosteroid isomerase-like protein